MIGIVDYGMGNLHSVSKALERLQYPYFVSNHIEELTRANGIILPGVGSFNDAMNILQKERLDHFLKDWAAQGKPLLGICLGMQLLFENSEENGYTDGLCLLKGNVRKFKGINDRGETYKVPHIGWNRLRFHVNHPILSNVEHGHVYFVHSYVVQGMLETELLASSEYEGVVPAVVGKGNVIGTQFHPEKSSIIGMKLLENFSRIVEGGKE